MINQPHQGAIDLLETYFYGGRLTGSYGTAHLPKAYIITFYNNLDNYTSGVFYPWDDNVMQTGGGYTGYEMDWVTNSTGAVTLPSWISSATNLYIPKATMASADPLTNNNRVQVIQNVPQIEFPEVRLDFSDVIPPSSPYLTTKIYGYIVWALFEDEPSVTYYRSPIFREVFDPIITPSAGGILRFNPLLRIGNISSTTTLG